MRLDDLPEGNIYLLVKYVDGSHFRDTNPFTLAREFDRLKLEIITANSIRSGALLVRTRTKTSAISLEKTEDLLGRAITVEVADRLNTVEAVAHAPSLRNIDDDELIKELGPQGVVGVRRLGSRGGQRSPQLCLRFRGLAHPTYLNAGYERLPLRLWVRSPPMCRKCASFGHTQHWCRSEAPCCLRCAAPHHTDECQEEQRLCPHCGGPLAAWDRTCPVLQYRLRRAEEDQRAGAGPPYDPSTNGRQVMSTTAAPEKPTTEDVETQTKETPKMVEADTQTKTTSKKDATTTIKPAITSKGTECAKAKTKTSSVQTDDLPIFDGIVTYVEPPQHKQPAKPKSKPEEERQSHSSHPDQWWSDRTHEPRDADLPPAAGTRSSYKAKRSADDGDTLQTAQQTTSEHPEMDDRDLFPKEKKSEVPDDDHTHTFLYDDGSQPARKTTHLYRYGDSVRVVDLDLRPGRRALTAAQRGFYFDRIQGRRLYLQRKPNPK